ncbi:molybdate ABC transporter substrate-binding protein [Shimia sp.]|uniref:molybdate ABC transporter substrate-binding protein n=1 Tax=Shimia sp. TaxID=1954381 RepID=UPI003298C3FB
MMIRHLGISSLAALVTVLWVCFATPGARAGEVVVFAAASLKNAMDDVADTFEAETGHQVVVSLAGSSALARQITYGAPADVFLSANSEWMDYLEQGGLIDVDTRVDLLGNTLVLIAPKGGTPVARPVVGKDIPALLGEGRLAMALVEAVPAGQYGKAALEALGVWDQVQAQVAQLDNVRAALALVALGEARLGIVYKTDARASEDVEIVGVFPEGIAPDVVYPVAGLTTRDNPVTPVFLTFLQGAQARAAFERQGFRVLAEGGL